MYITSIGVVSLPFVARRSLHLKMAYHENIVKQGLNLPLTRSTELTIVL